MGGDCCWLGDCDNREVVVVDRWRWRGICGVDGWGLKVMGANSADVGDVDGEGSDTTRGIDFGATLFFIQWFLMEAGE